MDVGIDTDPRLLKSLRDDKIGSLPTNPFEGKQLIQISRDVTIVFCHQGSRDIEYCLSLCFVKSDWINSLLDLSAAESQHPLWGIREREEPPGRWSRSFVLRTQAEKASN